MNKEDIRRIGYYGVHICPGIYRIVCLESGRFYIGSAVSMAARWAVHRHHLIKQKHASKQLQRSWNKYGADAFSFQVVEFVDDKTKLIEREQFWIDRLKPEFNSRPTAGSQLGFKHGLDSRAKIAAAGRGRRWTEAQRAKFSASNKGRSKPPQWVAKMTGRKQPESFRIFISKLKKGSKHSDETKAKISATKRAQNLKCYTSPETRAKISAAMMGNKNGVKQ